MARAARVRIPCTLRRASCYARRRRVASPILATPGEHPPGRLRIAVGQTVPWSSRRTHWGTGSIHRPANVAANGSDPVGCGRRSSEWRLKVAQTNLETITNQPWLDAVGNPLSEAVRALFKNAGPAGQTAKNALHGVWLGHPLHPVLTDVPIGAWTTALALDAKASASSEESYGQAADFAFGVGLVAAVGAAVTGLNDWSETEG